MKENLSNSGKSFGDAPLKNTMLALYILSSPYGYGVAAAFTTCAVLTVASPWAQMGVFIGFLMLFTLVGHSLFVKPFSPEHESPLVIMIGAGILATIVCSIAIGCGMPFWCGFSAMSVAQVAAICSPTLISLGLMISVPLGAAVLCAPCLCISACVNSEGSGAFQGPNDISYLTSSNRTNEERQPLLGPKKPLSHM